MTADEAAFGFVLKESEAGVRIVVRALAHGLEAVKRVADDGAIEYAICSTDGRVLYVGARSLAELKHRFRL